MSVKRADARPKAPEGAPLRFTMAASMCDSSAACVEWPFGKSNGYGYLMIDGHKIGAHQAVIGCWHTPQPGDEVRHICDNRGCINPMHLLYGSRQDNVNDMMARKRHWRHTWVRR